MPKIALTIIVKDEETNLPRILTSAIPHVDHVFITDTGSTDKTLEVVKQFPNVTVFEMGDKFVHPLYEGGAPIFNFDEARQYTLEQVPKEYDYVLWLDADDELVDGQNIPKLLAQMDQNKWGMLFCRYIYYAEFNPDGTIKHILIEHLRERIIRNDDSCRWVAKLHETLISQRPVAQFDTQEITIVHHTTWDDMEKALYRNITTLQEVIIAENGKDPRNIYYLAKTLFDLHDPTVGDYTIGLLKQYLDTSGWTEERAQAWTYLGFLHLERNEVDDAIRACLMSFYESPKFPDSYVMLGLAYLQKRDWEKALHWTRLATLIDMPKTVLTVAPKDLQFRILEIIFQCSINTGRLKEAKLANEKLLELSPADQGIQQRQKDLEDMDKRNDMAHSILKLATYHKDQGNTDAMLAVLNAMPESIASEPPMVALRNEILPIREWADDEIAIYCGPGFEKWSPANLEQGLGGSEAAVIYQARELAKLGYKVTIFGDPQEQKYQDGDNVLYLPFFHFNPKDKFNIFIGWRQPALFDLEIDAKKKFVWLHDIVNPAEFIPERVARIDKILCLSKWQAEPLIEKGLNDKIYITRNGIPL